MRIIYTHVRRPCSSVLEYYGLPCGEYNGDGVRTLNIIYIIYNSNILIHIYMYIHTSSVYIIIRGVQCNCKYIYGLRRDAVCRGSLDLTGARFMVTFLFRRIIPFAGDRVRDNARPPSETNVLRFIINTVTYCYTLHQIFSVHSNHVSRLFSGVI